MSYFSMLISFVLFFQRSWRKSRSNCPPWQLWLLHTLQLGRGGGGGGGGGGGRDLTPPQSFWYVAVLRNDFTLSGKPLIFLTRCGIFYGWWHCWRPVTLPTMVDILAASLLKEVEKNVFSPKNGLTTCYLWGHILCHSNWPSLNLSQNVLKGWTNCSAESVGCWCFIF